MWKSLISSPQSLAHLALQTSTIHTLPKGYAAVARTLNASDLKAFINDGQQGVVLHPGTWHHGLVAVEVAKTRYLDLPHTQFVSVETKKKTERWLLEQFLAASKIEAEIVDGTCEAPDFILLVDGQHVGVASRTTVRSLVKQMRVRFVPVFHSLHRGFALKRSAMPLNGAQCPRHRTAGQTHDDHWAHAHARRTTCR